MTKRASLEAPNQSLSVEYKSYLLPMRLFFA